MTKNFFHAKGMAALKRNRSQKQRTTCCPAQSTVCNNSKCFKINPCLSDALKSQIKQLVNEAIKESATALSTQTATALVNNPNFIAAIAANIGSVEGLQGIPGPEGPTGPIGPQGVQGPIGLTGRQGAPGQTLAYLLGVSATDNSSLAPYSANLQQYDTSIPDSTGQIVPQGNYFQIIGGVTQATVQVDGDGISTNYPSYVSLVDGNGNTLSSFDPALANAITVTLPPNVSQVGIQYLNATGQALNASATSFLTLVQLAPNSI